MNRLKEEFGWLKVVLAVLVAVDASLVAWLAQNYARTEGILLIAGRTHIIYTFDIYYPDPENLTRRT